MPQRLLVTADRVLARPGTESAISDSGVLLNDDRIEAVGPCAALAAPADVERRDYPGCSILPGLIDGHVHLAFIPRVPAESTVPDTPDDELMTAVREHARELLSLGITTVRDLGDRDHLVARACDDSRYTEPLPNVVTAGPPITLTGGHCWYLGGETQPDDEALRKAVRLRAAQGAEWIKVMATGGNSTQGGAKLWEPQFSEEQLRVIVAEATACGLPVAAHAHGAATVVAAARAGVATIEHCTLINDTGHGVEFDPAIAEAIVDAGCWVSHADTHWWQAYAKALGDDVADELVTRTRWLADHNVRLFAGTDSGVSEFDQFVEILVREAQTRSPVELLESATANAAQALRLQGETGALAPGLRADVLVVEGDPTADIAALRDVREVIVGGRLV